MNTRPHPRHHPYLLVWTFAVLSSLAAWWAWDDLKSAAVMLSVIGIGGSVYTLFMDGETVADKMHYSVESRHRIHAGEAEWHDLQHFLEHPHWKRRITAPEREMLVHCTRTYHEGGRETNSAPVIVAWLRRGEDLRLLMHALTIGLRDDHLKAHLDGTQPITRDDTASGRA